MMIAAVPEDRADHGTGRMVLCQPGRSVIQTHDTTVCTEIAAGMMMTAIARSARARRRRC